MAQHGFARSPRTRSLSAQLRVLKILLEVDKWSGVPMLIDIKEKSMIEYYPAAGAWFSRSWEEAH